MSTGNTRLGDHMTPDEFLELLKDAEEQANNQWADNFCQELRERYDEFGIRMFLTETQLDKLREIAGYE